MAFDPTNRTRARGRANAAKLLDPGTVQYDYLYARAHARLTTGAIVMLVAFAVAFLVMLLLGYVLIPGGIFGLVLFATIRPPRAVVVADRGVAILHRSLWNNRPTKVLTRVAHAPPEAFGRPSGSRMQVQIGQDVLTFSKGEWARFTAAVHRAMAGGPPPPPATSPAN